MYRAIVSVQTFPWKFPTLMYPLTAAEPPPLGAFGLRTTARTVERHTGELSRRELAVLTCKYGVITPSHIQGKASSNHDAWCRTQPSRDLDAMLGLLWNSPLLKAGCGSMQPWHLSASQQDCWLSCYTKIKVLWSLLQAL